MLVRRRVVRTADDSSEGSSLSDAKIARILVFGRSVRIGTMMQSYASAAKLRGSGPILHRGLEAMEGTSGHRHLGSSSAAPSMGRQSGCHVVLLFLVSPAIAHAAGRKMTPSGTSPVVTRRHSAMSSLRASATIIVLRVLPRPSAVRASNHFAKALSFGT